MKNEFVALCKFTDRTYSNWKSENRPIIALIEKYFTKNDIKEFIDTGNINKNT